MELSELVMFDGKLLACDDRTGIGRLHSTPFLTNSQFLKLVHLMFIRDISPLKVMVTMKKV